MNTMNEINTIIKTVAELGYKIDLEACDYPLESEELFKIYRKCSKELIRFAPIASKKFYEEVSIDLLDHHILNIASEGFDNAFKIYQSRESIENVNTELPVFINIDDLDMLDEGKNECDNRFIDFFKKHNYTPYTFSYKDLTYYVLKDDGLDIFEKNFARTGISRNAFKKSLSDLYKDALKSLIEYVCSHNPFLFVDKNTEKITTPTNPSDARTIEILNYMDFEVREGKDPLGDKVFFLWDTQRQVYYLQDREDTECMKIELEENGIDCEIYDNYCLVDDLKAIDCYYSSDVRLLLGLIPDDYFKDYKIDQENMLDLEKPFLYEDVQEIKKVYAILRQPLINQCDFDIESAVMLYDNYNDALKVFIDNVQLDLKQYGIYRDLKTENDVNDAWEELMYKFEGDLEYYEILKVLEVN